MRHVLLIIISILSFSSINSKNEDFVNTNKIVSVSADTTVTCNGMVKINECDCIDYLFSQEGESPLLIQKIGASKIIICGYRHDYDEYITLGERLSDSSFYVSGFVVFDCSGSETTQLFEDGEYYLHIIKPKPKELEIVRLLRMPRDKSLKYKWTEILSIRFFEQNGIIKSDSSFVLTTNIYDQDFLKYFKSEIDRVKNDSTKKLNYYDYLIDYCLIQAVKNPEKYSDKLKSIGPFDGYLGPIYRDVLEYYELFEKEYKKDKEL